MKNRQLRRYLIISALFVIAKVILQPSHAHDLEANLSEAGGESATDLYSIVCFNDPQSSQEITHHLSVTVRNNVKTDSLLSVVVYKKTATAGISKSATDPKGGDYETSPEILLAGGEGEYLAFVHHSANTPQGYLLKYHCQDAQNNHTGTTIQTLQNE